MVDAGIMLRICCLPYESNMTFWNMTICIDIHIGPGITLNTLATMLEVVAEFDFCTEFWYSSGIDNLQQECHDDRVRLLLLNPALLSLSLSLSLSLCI